MKAIARLLCLIAVAAGNAVLSPVKAQNRESAPIPTAAARTHIFSSPNSKRQTAQSQIVAQSAAVEMQSRITVDPVEPLAEGKTDSNGAAENIRAIMQPVDVIKNEMQREDQTNVAGQKENNSDAAAIKTGQSDLTDYRVGAGDVLDIKLADQKSGNSTLFTIAPDGSLDYPLIAEPLLVNDLTLSEIADLLIAKVKIFEQPRFSIAVREFQSHRVTVSGAVERPGSKILRRSVVPLYTVLAEAGIQPTADKALLLRAGQLPQTIDLKNSVVDIAIQANDFIEVITQPIAAAQFYFVAGAIASPGQKEFHTGITLTQAVFAAGGRAGKSAGKAIILRQNAEGLIVTAEYRWKEIVGGKVADPLLQPGDRIEINEKSN